MQPNDKEKIPPDEAELISVAEDFVEIACGIDYHGNENGYVRDAKVILTIIDKYGRTVPGLWGKEWAEIAPGIQTRREEGSTRSGSFEHAEGEEIRIYRLACPVYVQFRYLYEYNSYEYEGSSYSRDEWIRYEAAASDSKQTG